MELRPILSALMRSKTGALLIAMQVALTLAILGNALYIVADRLAIAARPTGADEANTFQFRSYVFREGVDVPAMHDADLAMIRAMPGVVAVARSNMIPLGQSGWNLGVRRSLEDPIQSGFNTAFYYTGDSLVDALGLSLIEGRDFVETDSITIEPSMATMAPRVAILSRAMAEQLFPGETTWVGRTAYLGESPFEVVGVVERLQSPWGQLGVDGERSMIGAVRSLDPVGQYIVRTEPGQRDRLMREVEDALMAARDDRVHLGTVSLEQARVNRYRADRSLAWMLLAVVGLLLMVTASGIVGMATLWVNQRRKQIGVRRAIGARRFDILRYFLIENFLVTSAGIAVGIVLALGLNQLLISQLEVERLPLAQLPLGALGLWLLGLLAAFGPAWRASRIPPAEATRSA
ncbi:MAG: ABC transporter permease [Xanthomonadales bacterium]|nr:ABC transporter permease [Xanthomonadales bacterium]